MTWTAVVCWVLLVAVVVPTVKPQTMQPLRPYVGCFHDDKDRLFPTPVKVFDSLTPDLCIQNCRTQGYKYAGVQYGKECYCGSSCEKYPKIDESQCNYNCTGNKGIRCGGFYAMGVYTTEQESPPGVDCSGDFRPFLGYCLRISSVPQDWATAQRTCLEQGARLLEVENFMGLLAQLSNLGAYKDQIIGQKIFLGAVGSTSTTIKVGSLMTAAQTGLQDLVKGLVSTDYSASKNTLIQGLLRGSDSSDEDDASKQGSDRSGSNQNSGQVKSRERRDLSGISLVAKALGSNTLGGIANALNQGFGVRQTSAQAGDRQSPGSVSRDDDDDDNQSGGSQNSGQATSRQSPGSGSKDDDDDNNVNNWVKDLFKGPGSTSRQDDDNDNRFGSGGLSKTTESSNRLCNYVIFESLYPKIGLGDCSAKMSFICEKAANWKPEDLTYTNWFSLKTGNADQDEETYSNYFLQQVTLPPAERGPLCTTPVACQCRRKGSTLSTDVIDSKINNNPYSLNFENDWGCQLVNGDCQLRCQKSRQALLKTCFDFEMRALCPKTDTSTCAQQINKDNCNKLNKDCKDTPTGPICVERTQTPGQCGLPNGQPTAMKKCTASGDPHYRSFDGKCYNFMGTCCYTFVQICDTSGGLPNIEVTVCNDKFGRNPAVTKVAWTSNITVYVPTPSGVRRSFLFKRDKYFEANGNRISLPFSAGNVKVYMSQNRVILDTDLCFKLEWDWSSSISVSLGASYRGRTCGLCGNMNDNPEDDFVPYKGDRNVAVTDFADSYLVPTSGVTECEGSQPSPTTPVCSDTDSLKYKQDIYCGLLNPLNTNSPFYKAINGNLPERKELLARAFDDCVVDNCLAFDPDLPVRCSTLLNMNDVIIKDYHITPDDSWRNITNCRPQCPSNQVWTINRLSCEKSCTNLRPELTCENPAYYPGCECKTGMVKNSRGVCVDISQCNQCIVRLDPADPNSDTQTLEDGETVVLKECVLAVSCKLGNATRILLKQCDRNAVCDDNRCVCMDGFQGDGYTCVSKAETCAEGWKSYGRKCLRKIDTALTWEQSSQACCSLMAELARVDSLEEKLSIVSFLQDNAQPTDNFHLAGNTEMVPIGSRMNRLPSSVDKSKYTQLTDEANLLGCYYIDIKGNQGVGNCQQLRPAICEYDNPEIEQVTPTGTPAAPDVEFYIPQQGATVPRVGMWNAKDLCQNAGAGSLPHPRSEAQNTQLLNFLKTRTPQELGQYVRLGLDFSGTGTTFKWLDTAGQNTSSGYTNFATGQPFDPNSRRGVVLEVSTGKWLSWNQLSALTVVCQRNASLLVQDPRFVRLEGRAAMSQEQAKIECAKEGRGLPIIRTQEDFTQLVASLDVKTYWLDAVDMGRGQFRYSDGSSLANSYVVWATNEPDDLGNSKCVALRRDGSTYRFVSLPCAGTTPASVYPACGPKGRTTAYVWSPYLSIIAPAKRTVADILQERQQTLKFSCSKPMAVDCQVQLSSGDYVPLLSVSPASSCKVSDITCRNPAEQNSVCSSLRVRFFCPNEEDMCKTLQMDLGRSPCGGGKICVPGSSGCFSCQCPAGTQEDQNGVCRVPCGKCSLWGDPHYTTLANQQFDFQGNCTYFINGVCEDVKDGDIPPGVLRYVIYNKNTKCGAPTNNVTCFKKLVVKFSNVPTADGLRDITIYKDRDLAPVLINGQAMQGTMYRLRSATNEELITITRTDSSSISIRAMGGLQINMASASARLEVIPPAALHDKMCGLCGQCGSASIFKLGDKSGRTISIAKIGTKLNPKDALTMGNTWQRYDPAIVDETTCKPVTEPAPECSLVKVQAAQLECSLLKNPLGIFADCFSVVKPDSYYEDCVYDRCRDASDKCSHLQKYADECTLNNIRVNWRQTANCSLPCEKEMGKEYSFTANCQRECGQLMPICRQSIPSDGCVCKEGLFYLNGSCVTQRECGCPYRDVTIDMVLHPNEEVFDSRCDTKVQCQAGGQLQVSDYKSIRDPNSICTDDRPPRITCARGFTLVDRNGTDACQRNINECAGEFTMVGDRCLSVPVDSLIWRRAVEACNERNSTLFYVDTVTKFNALVGLMREKNLKKVFISGQVTAGPSGTLSPLLDNTQGSLLKYRNFAVSKFVRDVKTLIAPLNFRSFTPPTFAVALVLDESDQPRLEPVPRFQPLNFVCEERTEEPEDYTWTNYCNSDTNPQIDGNDVERVSALIAMPNCSICPVPTGAQCRRSSSASGSQQGTCGWANKVLYTCENNPNCVDMEVSGLCPPDVDECAEALDDCPTGSSCVNTHGAYLCKCDRDPYRPLMVINECQQRQTCTMEGTQNFIYDLQLQTFTASAAGFLSYDCAMTFASTVCNGAPTRVDVPNIEIEVNNRWLGDHAEQNISVMITAPDGRSSVFQSTPSARARGGILVNSCFRTPTFVENGIVRVYGSTGDTITLADPNNRYSIAIRPGKDGGMASLHLEISGDYLNRMCGLCTLGEASNMVYNLDDQTLSQVSRGSRPCALIRTTTTPVPTTTTTLRTTLVPIVMPTTPPPPPQSTPAPIQTARPTTPAPPPPPPPTVAPVKPTTQPLPPTEEPARQPTTTTQRPTTQPTTPPTTTTTTTTQRPTTETRTTPTTTTKPPPTTPAPVVYCEFCQKLHDICSGITLHSCQLAACDIGDICGYMAKHADFVDCGFNAVERLNALYLSQCQSQCEAIDMVLKLVPKGEVPTCTNPIPRLSSEDGFVTMQYECACDYDKHRVRRGNRCIPIAECNDCILDNGDARKNGEVWSESTCSNISRCDRGVVVTEPRRCDKDRTNCVNDDGFWQCHCKEPYKGYPDMPGGCVEGTNEGPQTCFHMADGQAACYCNEGFAPTCNGCEDVDECVLGTHNCSARRQYCKNTISSFECVCQTGFQLTIDGRCVDINECYSNPCGGEGAVCVNFVGGYSCQCCAGYDSVGGGVCQRNTERVPILPPDAPCCAPCPPNQPLCINPETGPISGCYEEDGRRKEYSEYRFVFEDLCLRNKTPSALYWTPGPCPATPGPNEEGPPNSEPSNPSSPSNCNRNTACRNMPPPAAQLTGKVCGPDSNPQTFNSYCDMLIALCIRQGGASSFRPPTSVVAKPGECSPTTTPLPETTLQPLNFDNWSKWSPCSFDSEIATCGKGTSFRLRTLIDSNPPRSPLPSELRQEGVCYVRCPDFGDTTPTPSENCPKFSDCKFLDYVCGTYGSRPLATYSSECILNVTACLAGKDPFVKYRTKCPAEDENPRELCETKPDRKPTDIVYSEDPKCVARGFSSATCSNRLCATGPSNTCCQPKQVVSEPITYLCSDGSTIENEINIPVACECVADNEF